MVRKRHPGVVAEIIIARDQGHSSPFNHSCPGFQGVAGNSRFRDANWEALAQGARPNRPNPEEEIVDTVPNHGWQRPASAVLEKDSLDELRRQLTEPERALMLSQGGPMAGEPFSSFSTTKETRFDPLPLYCLPLPMWPSLGCVRDSWSVGEAWVCIGVGRRKGLLRGRVKGEDERACEGTGPPPRPEPSRRPAFGSGGGRFGAFQRDPIGNRHHFGLGTPCRRDRLSEGSNSGWRSPQKSQGTEGENRSRTRWRGRTRQIGGPCCMGGRWSNEVSQFVRSLAWVKAQSAPESTQTQVAHACNRRWRKLLAFTAATSFANMFGARVTNRCRRHNTLRG